MLTDLLFLVAAAACAGIYGLIRQARARVAAAGMLVLAWRFLSGNTWHGKALTDAGWLRPGTRAFTPSGHALRFHYRPRWQRACWRTIPALAVLTVLLFFDFYPRVAVPVIICLAFVFLAFGSWRSWRWLQEYKHRRTWLHPVHRVLAPVAGYPLAIPAQSWISVDAARTHAELTMPRSWEPDPKTEDRIARVAAQMLGIESPEVTWKRRASEPLQLILQASEPPPDLVTLDDIMAAIEQARSDELVWGLGKRRKPAKNSLSGDSPHWGLSMGSGAGKSITARALAAQVLYHGGIVLILDYKMISHHWARHLPNVRIYRRPHELHEALLWLGRELERRNEVALAGADDEGNVHATVGPRLFIICEELNATMGKLRKYWNEIRAKDDPKRSPALGALDAASFMGRQVLCNILYIGQRLSVKAAGGDGDARENIGVIGFGRYSPSNWKMLAGEHPMPPKSLHPGRLQIVATGVTEVQAVKMSAAEAQRLALAGTVARLPAGMPGAPRVTGGTHTQIPGPDQGVVTVTGAPPITAAPARVTLKEAVDEGIVSCSLAAIRIARHRGGGFPEPDGQRGLAHEYDPLQLAEWDAGRR
jgi:hypothetical protein